MTDIEKIKAELKKINEARNNADKDEWYLSLCNSGENCWCRCVSNKKDSDDLEHCVIPSGSVNKNNAEFIVLAANRITQLTYALNVAVESFESIKRIQYEIRDGKRDYYSESFKFKELSTDTLKQISEILTRGGE